MATKNNTSVETAPCEVIIRRRIAAPRELVFDAFTDASQLAKWFGPRIFTATAETDPRVGGRYTLAMHGPENGPPEMRGPFPIKGEYREVVRPERLVYTSDLSDHPQSWKDMLKRSIAGLGSESFLTSLVTITFEEVNGDTNLTIRNRFESNAIRDGYLKLQMGEGWSGSLDKLEELLAK